MTAEEIVARIDVDAVLAKMARDHETVAAKYSILSRTEDYIAELIPLLEPYFGPAEQWIAAMVPGGPVAQVLALLVEKALAAGISKWAAGRRAKENA